MDTRTKKYKNLTDDINKALKMEKRKKKHKILYKILTTLFIVIVMFFTYALFIEPNIMLTHEIHIKSSNITDDFNGLKIVHMTDFHYGMTTDTKYLKRVVKEINRLKPDIFIFTGDLIDQTYKISKEEKKEIINCLKDINTTYGKYAVTGNHDYFNENYEDILKQANITLLNNSYDIIYNNDSSVLIYGVDDSLYSTPVIDILKDKNNIKANYRIVLTHESDYTEDIAFNTSSDLILAGHSHNAQVNIPFIKPFYLPEGAKKYYKPYYNLNNTDIYISNGIGTSSFKIRFMSVPSINFYRITKATD